MTDYQGIFDSVEREIRGAASVEQESTASTPGNSGQSRGKTEQVSFGRVWGRKTIEWVQSSNPAI